MFGFAFASSISPMSSDSSGVSKVAFCSAIFAGAAYVGYSVARNTLWRWNRGTRQREPQTGRDF